MYTNKDTWGSGDVTPRIFNIGITCKLLVSLVPQSFYPLPTKKKASVSH